MMIHETIQKIEAKIQNAGSLKPESRAELLALLAALKAEVTTLAHTDAEQAHSIAGFTEVSTHEATRADKKPELLSPSLAGLQASVTGFEKSHPQLVAVVNRMAQTLSDLGI